MFTGISGILNRLASRFQTRYVSGLHTALCAVSFARLRGIRVRFGYFFFASLGGSGFAAASLAAGGSAFMGGSGVSRVLHSSR